MSDTTEIEIPIDDDPPAPAEAEVVVEKTADAAPVADDTPTVDVAMEALRDQLAQAKAEKDAAEQRAYAEAKRAHEAEQRVEDTDLALVVNAISQLKTTNDHLEQQQADAFAAGDMAAAARIGRAMSANEAKLLTLEAGKAQMEAAPKPEARAPAPPVADPVEAIASQLTPRSAAWVRSHPEFARDSVKMRKMIAAHNLVEADGVQPDTDEYFDRIEGILGVRQAQHDPDDATSMAAQPVARRAAPPAAPVSRAPPGTNGTRPGVVRLSAEEREFAKLNGQTEQEYAKNKLALIKAGKIQGNMH